MPKLYISLIIPCYNEGQIFEKSVEKIIKELRKLGRNWEIIFVEDKGQDKTKKSVEKFIKSIPNAQAVFHRKNEGRGKSVADGIKIAKCEICGYLDVDLEVSEKYI